MYPVLLLVLGLTFQVFIPGFPKEVLLVHAGARYGLIAGTMINWIGMILAAQVGYEVMRSTMTIGQYLSSYLNKYENNKWYLQLQQDGNKTLFLIRLIPYAPNDVLSLLSGVIKLPRTGFLLVSIITALPFAIIFAYIGVLGNKYLGQETFFLVNGIILIISLFTLIITHLKKGENTGKTRQNNI